jgi:cytochrome P450
VAVPRKESVVMSTLVDFDPFSAEVIADPYPWYDLLREESPVQWVPSRQLWMVTGYEEVGAVLRDPAVYSSTLGMDAVFAGRMARRGNDMRHMLGVDSRSLRILVASDPPDHTRLRRLLSRAFTPKAMAELEPRLQTICSQLVHQLVAKAEAGEADLARDLAVPFPVTVIAELLGIPAERRHDFRRWSDAMVGALSGDWNMDEAEGTAAEMLAFMAEVVDERRTRPGDDLVTRLVTGADPDDPDRLNLLEITMFTILLLVAGNETTTNLLGNAAAAFAAHPEQAELLWARPDLLPDAIEEVLRWDSPVQGLLRGTTQPTTLGRVDLPAGALVLVSFAGANRDPSHFEEPSRFDIRRRPGDHYAFGHGIHFCLGASLARVEARLAGECLLEAGIKLMPRDGAVRTTSFILRGFTAYPVVRVNDLRR